MIKLLQFFRDICTIYKHHCYYIEEEYALDNGLPERDNYFEEMENFVNEPFVVFDHPEIDEWDESSDESGYSSEEWEEDAPDWMA